jgi:hypothetical protein
LGAYSFSLLSRRLFPPESLKHITAVVFTQTPELLVCFRFRSSASHIFVIFDAHSRSEHPFGPAFILASDIDVIATHVNQLLTQPSISKSTTKQDDITNCSITALVIESRDRPSAIDEQDLLAKSVAFLFEKFITVDRISSNLDLYTPVFGLEQLRVRETQRLVHAPHNNQQTSHSKPLTRRSEFGWQLNLQVSDTSSAVDPKNNNLAEHPNPLEVRKTRSTIDLPKTSDSKSLTRRNEFGWQWNLQVSDSSSAVDPKNNNLAEHPNLLEVKKTRSTIDLPKTSDSDLLLDPGPDGKVIVSNADEDNTAHSLLRSRSEFGWQLALQQTSIKDSRCKLEDLEIVASAILSQAEKIQRHRVVVGKEREEASDEFFATQTLKGSISAWEDNLTKQLQDEEELVASSAGYLSQESAWILSWRKLLIAEEDKVNNAAASSSSTSYTQLGQEDISSFLHEFDFKHLSSTESESSTIHRPSRHSPLFPSYLDALQSSNRFTTLELPTNEFLAESHECGVCNELHGAAQIIQLPTCKHTFCRECLRTFTKTRINEGRYPILCPVCAIERTRINHSRKLVLSSHFSRWIDNTYFFLIDITQAIVEKLELSNQDLAKLSSLKLVAHSVTLECPK